MYNSSMCPFKYSMFAFHICCCYVTLNIRVVRQILFLIVIMEISGGTWGGISEGRGDFLLVAKVKTQLLRNE